MSPTGSRAEHGWKCTYDVRELLVVSCPRCGSDDARPVARELGVTIARCRACRLTYTRTPLPDSQGHYHVDREVFARKSA